MSIPLLSLWSMSRIMRSSTPFHVCWLVICLVVVVSSCTPSPNANPRTVVAAATTTTTSGTTTCAAAKSMNNHNHNNHNNNNQIFGVPEAKLKTKVSPPTTASLSSALKQTIQELRGGELHEPETLADTEALVLNAATNRKLLVIDFTASWCGPCKAIAPLYEDLSEEFDGEVVFCKVDVDENPDTAAKYSVSAMPTFVFISKGVVVDRLMGANPAKLRELIEEHM